MPDRLMLAESGDAVPLTLLAPDAFAAWKARQPASLRRWLDGTGFAARPATFLPVPGAAGALGRMLAGIEPGAEPWSFGALPGLLPEGLYRLEPEPEPELADRAALGWALGGYVFDRYKKPARPFARLLWPRRADRAAVERAAAGVFLTRDLINMPAEDMGPGELAAAAQALARSHRARVSVLVGEELLKWNYPTIHAVGRASSRAPRLIDLRWGRAGPRLTLVGKGVCFDSGGLDLKTAEGMKLMKKDMGGAAQLLALAGMIMAASLPLRLRLLIPAVENAVAGNAFRPRDVIRTRKGLTVEVGNTDAEGRLVLCDALAEASTERPALIVDCATLTGAARVALGTELPALFCNDDALAESLLRHGRAVADPLWRLPLHRPYRRLLDSKVADLSNVSEGPYGGAITAALYLAEFVGEGIPWIHIDMMGWNLASRPGRPEGGEAQGLRALYALIAERFAGEAPRRRSPRGAAQ